MIGATTLATESAGNGMIQARGIRDTSQVASTNSHLIVVCSYSSNELLEERRC